MPQNYLESKFMLEATSADLEKAKQDKKDVGQAEEKIALARQCFESGDYNGSLRECMRARRALSGQSVEAAKPEEVGKKQLPSQERVPLPTTKAMNDVCLSCGEELVPGDNFCGKCGSKVDIATKCPGCGTLRAGNDAFCRKCGTRYD